MGFIQVANWTEAPYKDEIEGKSVLEKSLLEGTGRQGKKRWKACLGLGSVYKNKISKLITAGCPLFMTWWQRVTGYITLASPFPSLGLGFFALQMRELSFPHCKLSPELTISKFLTVESEALEEVTYLAFY